MAITTEAGYEAAKKQDVQYQSITNVTTLTGTYYSAWTGTLAGANTANGVVPTDADVGAANLLAALNPFAAGALGYITKMYYNNMGANGTGGTGILFDMVFKAGAYAFNANTTLTAQPSYASRMPNGTDYTNTEIWIETVTAFTGNLTVTVTYTNQDGTTGRSTGSFAPGVAPAVRRCFMLPLQSGDTGVRAIESVVSTVATAGTFNVLVLRRLAQGRNTSATAEYAFRELNIADVLGTGAVQIFDNSCLTLITLNDSTALGQPYFEIEGASG